MGGATYLDVPEFFGRDFNPPSYYGALLIIINRDPPGSPPLQVRQCYAKRSRQATPILVLISATSMPETKMAVLSCAYRETGIPLRATCKVFRRAHMATCEINASTIK